MKSCSITGIQGFLGKTLSKKLNENDWNVFDHIRPDVDIVFLFGAPSSTELFKQNIDKCLEDTINTFLNAIQFCRDHKIRLVYPSSATVYNKNTPYARCKAILEEIQLTYNDVNTLGIRIAAGYGPNESHKSTYASIVYQFCQQMKKGKRPEIWGDGTQTRDFIYQDDVIDGVITFTEKATEKIVDLGTGVNSSFNEVVTTINRVLGKNIQPIYLPKPKSYVDETPINTDQMERYGIKPQVALEEGIRRTLNE